MTFTEPSVSLGVTRPNTRDDLLQNPMSATSHGGFPCDVEIAKQDFRIRVADEPSTDPQFIIKRMLLLMRVESRDSG